MTLFRVHTYGKTITVIMLFILNTEPDYPQNYLIINDTGVHLAGVDVEFNHALPVTTHPPLAVDTINRFVYWYHESPRSIARHSLNSDNMDIHVCLTLARPVHVLLLLLMGTIY